MTPLVYFVQKNESVQHLLVDYVVAHQVWEFISEFFEIDRISSFENIFAF